MLIVILPLSLVGCQGQDDSQAPTKEQIDKGLEGQPKLEPMGQTMPGKKGGAGGK
jgi:hypothetical protein